MPEEMEKGYGHRKCATCGKEVELKIKRDINRKRFCSTLCRDTWRVENCPGTLGNKLSDQHKDKLRKKALERYSTPENHPTWTGGRHLDGKGYIDIFISKGKYKTEHRMVAEKALGRELKRGEMVHHINGDKTDNRNHNLLICDPSYHRFLHHKMDQLYQTEHFGGN